MKNPAFNHAGRPAYELPGLIKTIGGIDSRTPLDADARNAVNAASSHANNAKETLLMGIEAVGSMMMQLSQIPDPMEQHEILGIGGLIRHMAVELQYLVDVEDEMDGIVKRAVESNKKGGAI